MPEPLSALDLAARVDAGSLTPLGAVELCAEAIERHEGEVGAFAHLDLPAARRAAERGAGPLRGVPVGVKDIIDTGSMPTGMGSPVWAGWRPRADAPLVSMLRAAGAPIVAKTETTPFAFLDPARTRNPFNAARSPGGSSSGSAAAVGAGMLPLAVGTQTGGSVIRPASYCGVAAVKPSFRLLPTVGVKCFSWTLDTVGLFARSVEDVAFGLSAITGREGLRVDGRAPAAPRFGLVRQGFAGPAGEAGERALDEAVRAAERAGASVREIAIPGILAEAWAAQGVIQDYEARRALAWEWTHHREAIGPLLTGLLEAAGAIQPEEYDAARRIARRARGALRDLFGEVDGLLTYASPGAAPHFEDGTGTSTFNRLWTLMGNPCVAVPGLRAGDGMPVGVQIVGAFGRDEGALEAGLFLERAIAARS